MTDDPRLPPPGGEPGAGMPPPPSSSPMPPQYSAPPGYSPYAGSNNAVAPQKSGVLLAGGIVCVVLAVFVLLIGFAIVALGDALDGFGDFGDALKLIGVVVLAFGGFGIASGIGAIMRRQWGRICSIVFGGVNLVFVLISLAGDGTVGDVIVWAALSGAIVFLCAKGPATT